MLTLATIIIVVFLIVDTLAGLIVRYRRRRAASQPMSPLQGGWVGQRVVITDVGNAVGWKGVMVEAYDDCYVIAHGATLSKDKDGATIEEPSPNPVCIPANRLLIVENVSDAAHS